MHCWRSDHHQGRQNLTREKYQELEQKRMAALRKSQRHPLDKAVKIGKGKSGHRDYRSGLPFCRRPLNFSPVAKM